MNHLSPVFRKLVDSSQNNFLKNFYCFYVRKCFVSLNSLERRKTWKSLGLKSGGFGRWARTNLTNMFVFFNLILAEYGFALFYSHNDRIKKNNTSF